MDGQGAPHMDDSTSRPSRAHHADDLDSDTEVALTLQQRSPNWAQLTPAVGVLASAVVKDVEDVAPDGREDEDADLEENDQDDEDVDGIPIVLDVPKTTASLDTEAPPPPTTRAPTTANQRDARGAHEPTDSEADKAGEIPCMRLFEEYWRDNVSKLHPPHAWYTQSSTASADNPPLIGCTLTLTLPNSTSRTLSVPPTHATRKSARDAAFALAWEGKAYEAARELREERGWEVEWEEERAEAERVRGLMGGEKPWEALRSEGEKWMAEPLRWEFVEDELNRTHACRLMVTISPSSTLTFLTPATYTSHRHAKDAAARLALEAGVVAQYEAAFKERLNRESGGFIQFGAAKKAGEDAEMGDKDSLDPVTLLQAEVKNAFGGVNKYVQWTLANTPKGHNGSSANPLLSCTFTLTFPSTPNTPTQPPPFIVSVPPLYHTKQHARISCAALAYREGVLALLKPYQDARAEELRGRKEDRERREREKREEREKGGRVVPNAGTVPYEELETLENPAAYLNLCAQQWTGSSSPLKFEYRTAGGKQHGCTITVFIDRSFSKSYTAPSSPSAPTRAAAKEAAIRLALRERVLDLIQPADFDVEAAAAGKSAKKARKAKARESAAASSAEGSSSAGGGKRTRKARAGQGQGQEGAASMPAQGQSAIAFLDQVCLERLGTGGLPQYDVRQDPTTGFFGAVLRIPLSPPTASAGLESHTTETVHPSRTQAQEAVAAIAVRGGVVEQLGRPAGLPRRPSWTISVGGGHALETVAMSSLQPLGTARPAAVRETSAMYVDGADVQQAGGPHTVVAVAATHKGAGGAIDAAPRSGVKRKLVEEEELIEDGYHGGPGDAVRQLREGCATIYGYRRGEDGMLPRYKVVQKGSVFGASVIVTLDKLTSATRAFGVPARYPSRDTACIAAAHAALSAGVLELVQARSRLAHLPGTPAAPPKPRNGEQSSPTRSAEEQAAARRAAYGGFGAVAVAKEQARMREDKEKEAEAKVVADTLLPLPPPAKTTFAQPPSLGGADALRPASATGPASVAIDGPAVAALKDYCLAKAQRIPLVCHEPLAGGAAHRVWVIVKDLRFELPSVAGTASAARDRLAARVLKHLKAQEGK